VTYGNTCPHCGRDAPIVYRGVVPSCTACGGVRAPLSSSSVNLAGRPSNVGGAVASILGWLVLLVGLSIAGGAGLLFGAIATVGVALAIALPIGLVTLGVGVALLGGGHALRRSGTDAKRSMHEQALLAMAAHHGAVTAADAARALGLSVADADAVLTALAKRDPDRMAVDVDDQGVVWYRAVVPVQVRVGEPARMPDVAGDPRADDSAGEAGSSDPGERDPEAARRERR
jgi:hypothetical protein